MLNQRNTRLTLILIFTDLKNKYVNISIIQIRPRVLWYRGVYLVNGEHVEMCDVIFLGIFDPGSALLLID